MKQLLKTDKRFYDPGCSLVRGYKILFILLSRQSWLPNLCYLTKEATDLVDQEIQDLLMRRAIVVSMGATRIFSIFLLKKCCYQGTKCAI